MNQEEFVSQISQDIMRKKQKNLQVKQFKMTRNILMPIAVLFVIIHIVGKQDNANLYVLIAVLLFILLSMKIKISPFGKVPEPTKEEMKKNAEAILTKIPKELIDLDSEKQLLEEKQKNAEFFLNTNV